MWASALSLPHLSQQLFNQSIHPSTFSNIFSETIGPIELQFHMRDLQGHLFSNALGQIFLIVYLQGKNQTRVRGWGGGGESS